MLIAPAAAAQMGFQVGGLLSWIYELDDPWDSRSDAELGVHAGLHYTFRDHFRIGARYAGKGHGSRGGVEWGTVHSVEVPITYRHPTGDFGHVFLGVAPGYDHHGIRSKPLEISALLGMGVCLRHLLGARPIQLEAAFTYGLIGAQHDTSWEEIGYKTIRIGLSVR